MKDAAPDFEGSKADKELERHRQHWLATLPTNEHGTVEPLLEWALKQDIATLIEFLAFCVANSIDGLQHTDDTSPLDGIAIPSALMPPSGGHLPPTATCPAYPKTALLP